MSYEQLAASVDALAEANRSLTEQSLETQAGSIAASDNATAKAQEATQAALSAEDSARVATDAANQAKEATDVVASTEDGIATGKQFFYTLSPESSEVLILWENVDNIAVDTGKRTPSQKAVTDVTDNFKKISERVGYSWGVLDSADRLGIGLTVDGKLDIGAFKDVVGHILSVEAKTPEERSERSGYLWGVMDLMDRLAIALDTDGNLINKGRNILSEMDEIRQSVEDATSELALPWSLRSGYWWGVMDSKDRLAIALDGSGNLINKGRNILSELDKVGDSKWITPNKNLATWGDSLSDSSWQPYLKLLMPDRDIYAGALPGKRAEQIARLQGGVAPMITIEGGDSAIANTIPASGPVVVKVDVPFLSNSKQLSGHLYGVYGILSAVNNVHSFTRATSGDPVQIDEVTPFIKSSVDYPYEFDTTVIWAGNNNAIPEANRLLIDYNVIRMVEYLKPQDKRFIVLGMAIADYPDRHKGTPYYADTMVLHAKWRERWPNNFIDITPILQRHYDPNNPTDVQNLIDGCTPSSLRVDEIHLNDAGKQIVAQAIYDFIINRGW